MGVSTDAILFYGYCWDEEWYGEEPAWAGDWETAYAAARGVIAPTATYPERVGSDGHLRPTDYSAEEQAIIDQYSAYWKAQREVVTASSALVGEHCSNECRMTFVAIRASVTKAHRGDPRQILSLDIDSAWRWQSQLEEFCDLLQIDVSGKKLGWWMASWWDPV